MEEPIWAPTRTLWREVLPALSSSKRLALFDLRSSYSLPIEVAAKAGSGLCSNHFKVSYVHAKRKSTYFLRLGLTCFDRALSLKFAQSYTISRMRRAFDKLAICATDYVPYGVLIKGLEYCSLELGFDCSSIGICAIRECLVHKDLQSWRPFIRHVMKV